jgi:dipeptidyl aminopeptidase/acylaminoacyl peptidase
MPIRPPQHTPPRSFLPYCTAATVLLTSAVFGFASPRAHAAPPKDSDATAQPTHPKASDATAQPTPSKSPKATKRTTTTDTAAPAIVRKARPTTKPAASASLAKAKLKTPAAKPANAPKPAPRPLRAWLLLGPAPLPLPLFSKDKEGSYKETQLLADEHLDQERLRPQIGQEVSWLGGRSLRWRPWGGGSISRKSPLPQAAWAATWLHTTRYTEATLILRSHQRLRVLLDGKTISTQATCTPAKSPQTAAVTASSSAKPTPPPASLPTTATDPRDLLMLRMAQILERQSQLIERQTAMLGGMLQQAQAQAKSPTVPTLRVSLKLTPGLHRLVIKTLATQDCLPRWGLQATLEASDAPSLRAITADRTPTFYHSIDFVLYRKYITTQSLSPDGKHVALSMQKLHPNGHHEYWSELRDAQHGHLLHSLRAVGALRDLQWSPNGRYYSFSTTLKGQGAIWRVDRQHGSVRLLRSGLRGLWGHAWVHDSRTIVYNASLPLTPTETEKAGLLRLRGMFDRWPWHRNRSHIYAMSADGKMHLRLTAGYWGNDTLKLHPSAPKILFRRSIPDDKARPFRKSALFELDLRTLQITRILDNLGNFFGASYAMNGDAILISGGPSLFGILGHAPDLPLNTVPNEYDGEIYLYHRKTKQITCLTRTFDPSVERAFWHPLTQKIYLNALHRTRRLLYELDPKNGQIRPLAHAKGLDILSQLRAGRQTHLLTYIGSGLQNSESLYRLDLRTGRSKLLYDPNQAAARHLQLGPIADWDVTLKQGEQRDGHVFYPPGFDPRKRYPLIVYYYGGTYPVTRTFDGRYPFHLWAAQGYVVYVLQPSGAIGFGQRFSARHVNEWGTLVPSEIIQSTRLFLRAHPFIDPKRVGCIGASYGGFTTMSVVTKTRLFAAAISHAGISNIPSYWGGGYWGYLYSAISAAHRYPWSHPDYFTRQSPLFSANKIHTPLLLLHGSHDTNVPAIESYQMYAALRLLKRPVEMVVVKGEDHWILQPSKRILWSHTILAWFDRHLKKQPLWWTRLHGNQSY